jgi:hypothetical protein
MTFFPNHKPQTTITCFARCDRTHFDAVGWILFAVLIRTPFPHLSHTTGHLGKFRPACSSNSGIEKRPKKTHGKKMQETRRNN